MDKFRNCQQSGFCKRNRKLEETTTSPYNILPDTITVEGSRISADIYNTKTNITFSLDIIAYANRIVRMKINEKTPLKPRYEVRDVLLPLKVDTLKFLHFEGFTLSKLICLIAIYTTA